MTLDHAEILTITDNALAGRSALCSLAGQVLSASADRQMIIVTAASPAEQDAMDRQSNRLGVAADVEQRANLSTLAPRESAQRFVGLLTMLGVEAKLLDPFLFAPITRGSPLEAEPRLLHARRFDQASREARVLVIAGGVGRTPEGRLTSLGTGGAVLSGLFIAQRLGLGASLVVGEAALAEFDLSKRATLFARRHGLGYRVVTRIDTVEQEHTAAAGV